MKDCWSLKSESRPTFANLVKKLSSDLESLASYEILGDGCHGDIDTKRGHESDGDPSGVNVCNEDRI